MKIKNIWAFSAGIFVLVFLLVAYLVKINIDSGANYNIETPLLGILIFYNLFVLGFYVLIALVLIVFGLRGFKKSVKGKK